MTENRIIGNKLGIIISVIILLTYFIGPVVAFTNIQNRVDNFGEDLNLYESRISIMELRVQQLEIIAATTSVSLTTIQEDISEIKDDIKDVRDLVR